MTERASAQETNIDAIARREAEGGEGTGRGAPQGAEGKTALTPGEAAKEGGGTGAAEAPERTTESANRAIAERPDLRIASEDGQVKTADSAHLDALNAEARANAEADPMFKTAVDCEAHHA